MAIRCSAWGWQGAATVAGIACAATWLLPAAAAAADGDADGVVDFVDNCVRAANATQRDSDGDRYGNACDPDLDGDGVVAEADLALLRASFFSADPHADLNGDGLVDFLDLGRMKLHFFGVPGPSGLVSEGLPGPVAEQPAPGSSGAGGQTHTVLAWNDLGMHCADLGSQPFSVLPPFNVLNAQLILRGTTGANRPVILDAAAAELRYSAASNPDDPVGPGSVNSTGQNFPVGATLPTATVRKTDFWDRLSDEGGGNVASRLFSPAPSAPLTPDLGLIFGQPMPGIAAPYTANDPKPFAHFEGAFGWFSAPGIPITDVDDSGRRNSYPLQRVQAVHRVTGEVLATVDAVVPVSTEVDCRDCHALGEVGADPAARGLDLGFVAASSADRRDVERAAKTNIVRLHDFRHGTTLEAEGPLVCAGCHRSNALAEIGGPQGDPGRSTMSEAMHAYHGRLQVDSGGALVRDVAGDPVLLDPLSPTAIPLVPEGNDVPMEENCFQCHPGKETQCFRGAMFEAGLTCNACHGGMLAVGGVFELDRPGGGAREPWVDEPRCESCHTGDARDRLPGPLVRSVAYDPADPAATPTLASNPRFAENPGALYRNSLDTHAGVACEACHGSPHAIWPNPDPPANDNVTALQLQGHRGTIFECSTCHDGFGTAGSLDGPHGMHPVNDPNWIKGEGDRQHKKLAEQAQESGNDVCAACHGIDHRGTRLSRTPVDRQLIDAEGNLRATVAAGQVIGCDLCHSLEASF